MSVEKEKPKKNTTGQRSGPDTAEKLLEDYEDVFADIVNVLVYEGDPVVKPENLRDGPTASVYKAAEGELRQKNRDVLKIDTENGVEIRVYGLENQTRPSNVMPVRVMGYDFGSYDRNIRKEKMKNKEQGREADYTAELWPGQKLCPVVTLVLYFGTEPWSGPTTLHGMLNLPERLKPFVPDYPVNLVQVAFLEEEEISLFRSDFRIVAEFFRAKRLGNVKSLKYNEKRWDHVAELLDFFKIFFGDKRYGEVKKQMVQATKQEETNACWFLDALLEERLEVRAAEMASEMANKMANEMANKMANEMADKIVEEKCRIEGVAVLIETCQTLQCSRQETLDRVIGKYHLKNDEAESYLQQYWA